MKIKLKVLELDDRFEVVDQTGSILRVFNVRPSDGKHAKCIAHDRALTFVEVWQVMYCIDW